MKLLHFITKMLVIEDTNIKLSVLLIGLHIKKSSLNWKRPIILSNLSSEMPLLFETLKTSKNDFYRSEHQKKKGRNLSFLYLSFSLIHYCWQRTNFRVSPFTLVDKNSIYSSTLNFLRLPKNNEAPTTMTIPPIHPNNGTNASAEPTINKTEGAIEILLSSL